MTTTVRRFRPANLRAPVSSHVWRRIAWGQTPKRITASLRPFRGSEGSRGVRPQVELQLRRELLRPELHEALLVVADLVEVDVRIARLLVRPDVL
jgi:hypothetical protein